VSSFPSHVHPRTDSDQILGDFNPGVQLRGTPITAEIVHSGNVGINVMWRDVQGQVVSSSWSKTCGWVTSHHGEQLGDGMAEVVQGGDVDINMARRDAQGRFASASCFKSSGWDLPNPNGVRAHLDGRD
jgi:hypothetical protein